MVKHIKNEDKQLLESLIEKYGTKGVERAINRLNEWNMWDKPKSDDFYSAAIRQAERNRPRLIDVVDELPKRNHDAQRYKDDPEYHEHIKRLERQLEKTTDPQEAEYLERRINKLKSLSESVIDRLNEDSLDDFDIDGRIARKRNSVDPSYKDQLDIHKLIIINKIKNLSKDFLDKHNSGLRSVDCYTVRDSFTYSPDDLMEFVIKPYKISKEYLKELIEILKDNIDGIYGTSINDKSGIYHNELKLSVYMTVDNIVNY